MLRGSVTEVDDAAGLGTVTADDGTQFRFHVVEIADGSRTIEVGQSVVFQPLPRFGRFQAASIRKV